MLRTVLGPYQLSNKHSPFSLLLEASFTKKIVPSLKKQCSTEERALSWDPLGQASVSLNLNSFICKMEG